MGQHSQRRENNADIDLVYALGFRERLEIAASCPQVRHALRLSRRELKSERFTASISSAGGSVRPRSRRRSRQEA